MPLVGLDGFRGQRSPEQNCYCVCGWVKNSWTLGVTPGGVCWRFGTVQRSGKENPVQDGVLECPGLGWSPRRHWL